MTLMGVQVAMPAMVHSSSTVDITSPQRTASPPVLSSVESTRTFERSCSMVGRRWLSPPPTGKERATSTRSLSVADTSEP